MITRCRICEICSQKSVKIKRHYLRKTNFTCILCRGTHSVYHGPDDGSAGYSYECNTCHDYIKYSMDDLHIYKEEFYFGEWWLSQDYEDNTSYIYHDKHKSIKLPDLIDIGVDPTKLINKIKTYIIFS
jgi:hypothetical protein